MKIIKKIFDLLKRFCLFLVFCVCYVLTKLIVKNKVVGKANINKKDEGRVFIANHLEIYGPIIFFIFFHFKKAIWVNEKLMDSESVAKEMSYSVMNENNFTWAPIWFKKFCIFILKGFLMYILNYRVKSIPVDRDNRCSIITALDQSRKFINKKYSIIIFPEMTFKQKGMGKVFNGFATIGKYMYKKDNKIVSFYPVYVDKENKKTFVIKPIHFNPEDKDYATTIPNYVVSQINDVANESDKNNKQK